MPHEGGRMSTQLRRVPADWKHPTEPDYTRHVTTLAYAPPLGFKWRPLDDKDWATAEREWWWERIRAALARAVCYVPALLGLIEPPSCVRYPWTAEDHPRPEYWSYRPRWRSQQRTHFQLYEDVSVGTPIT